MANAFSATKLTHKNNYTVSQQTEWHKVEKLTSSVVKSHGINHLRIAEGNLQ